MIIKYISIKLLLVVIALNFACGLYQPPMKEGARITEQRLEKTNEERESYLIYSTVINNLPNEIGYVIRDKTTTYWLPYKNLNEAVEDLFKDKEEIADPRLLTSFLKRNRESVNLGAQFKLRYPYTILSSKKSLKIFKDGDWENFQKLYPDRFLIELSRIGYSSKKDEALVYMGNPKGSKAGSGNYFILKKRGTTWIIVREINVWVR